VSEAVGVIAELFASEGAAEAKDPAAPPSAFGHFAPILEALLG
jgi:hypothetical protein